MCTNVLLVVLDSVRKDHLSCYGYDRPTAPNLEEFAEDSVVFENAFSCAPWTPPSHGSLFTGTYPSKHGYFNDGMGMNGPTIVDNLSKRGYATYGAVSSAKLGAHTELMSGFDQILETYRLPSVPSSLEEANRHYFDLRRAWPRFLYRWLRDRAESAEFSSAFLKNRVRAHATTDAPFFGFVNYLCAHSKYDPPEPYRARFRKERGADREKIKHLAHHGGYQFVAGEIDVTEREWAAVQDLYDGEIAYADALVGDLIDLLKRQGAYDDTLLIITADHGEHFGEHQRAYHQFSLYDELINVPLIIKFPSQEHGGCRSDSLVSHVDIFPTVLNVTGSSSANIDGSSPYPLADHEREFVFAEYGRPNRTLETCKKHVENEIPEDILNEIDCGLQCIRSHSQKLIRKLDGQDEYYDLSEDPNEERNLLLGQLSGRIERQVAELNERLDAVLSDHPAVADPSVNDDRVEANLQNLGYL